MTAGTVGGDRVQVVRGRPAVAGEPAGDRAPDVQLVSLDGQTKFLLSERIGKRPLVLVFGSYT